MTNTLHAYRAEIDLALTYALRRPRLAIECAVTAQSIAIGLRRPDLALAAAEVVSAIGGAP